MEAKTPLYSRHEALGGKIVPFAGYLLPVQYPTGVIAEHMAVRTAAGLFDVSHMGELVFTGPDALGNLNHMLTNDFTGMYDGQVRYSPMCNDQGGCVDDLIVYKLREGAYLVVVNAANKDKDAAWMRAHLSGDCAMEDISARRGSGGPSGAQIKGNPAAAAGGARPAQEILQLCERCGSEGDPVPDLPHGVHW